MIIEQMNDMIIIYGCKIAAAVHAYDHVCTASILIITDKQFNH